MSKKSKITRPNREPDHYSKRNVAYWWAPEWIRATSADVRDVPPAHPSATPTISGEFVIHAPNYMKIHAVKEKKTVNLYMKAKDGNLSFIKGSIQKEFKRWHEDRSIDYMLFGMDPDEIILDENE